MSARSRVDRVDELLAQAAGLRLEPTDGEYEPGIERLALLLEAVALAVSAVAEADGTVAEAQVFPRVAVPVGPTRHQLADD